LLRVFHRRRRRYAAAEWKLAWKDRFRKLVTHRNPLAAALPPARASSAGEERSRVTTAHL
jgi:hypothetical protein